MGKAISRLSSRAEAQGKAAVEAIPAPTSNSAGESEGAASPPLFIFGVVADIQHADKDNFAFPSDPQRLKYYRDAIPKLAAAVDAFNAHSSTLSFVLTLGDIVDGNKTQEETVSDFQAVLRELDKLQVKHVFHAIGNHCLNVPRDMLLRSLRLDKSFYSVPLPSGWTLLVLDSMDLRVPVSEGSENVLEVGSFLEKHPLGSEPQLAHWNGGVGREQLQWLDARLGEADQANGRVIVAVHHPLAPGSAPPDCLCWNYAEVLDVLSRHPAAALVLCGHHHVGGYAKVGSIHFVVLEAILEAPPNSNAHALVRVYPDRVEINGSGFVTSRCLQIPLAGAE